MLVRVVDGPATVYAQPDHASHVVTDLAYGDVVQITGRLQSGDERHGYLPCATKMECVPIVELHGDAGMRTEPSEVAPVLVTYGAGARLWLLDMVVQEGRTWLKVQDGAGHAGFLPEGTRLQDTRAYAAAEAQIARGKRNMLVGGLWCVGGLAVTLVTYQAASGGGTYVVAWGAIVFGGWQAVKGLLQYLGAGD